MAAGPARAAPTRAPSAPVSAPVSAKAVSEFMQLKQSLNELVSWELSPTDWGHPEMVFSEAGSEQQARALNIAMK